MDTHRIHAYADMFDKMHRILEQARSESAWWPPARCRGILADMRKAICRISRRFEEQHTLYTAWDLSFSALLHPLWQTLHQETWDDVYELNVRVQRARLIVDALLPLLRAAQTIETLHDAMDQLDLEGSAEADDPNPVGVDG